MITNYNSDKYYVGSKFKTKQGYDIIILGKSHKRDMYWVQFQDKFKHCREVFTCGLRTGGILNPYHVRDKCGGYGGFGVYKFGTKEPFSKKRYNLWSHMMTRCYNKIVQNKHPTYKDVKVCERWHNFQFFCHDIKKLHGYENWKNSYGKNGYELDKDIKGSGKLYSKENCIFVPQAENVLQAVLTGKTYQGKRLSDGYTEDFTNQHEFARKHNLLNKSIHACLKEKCNQHRGWVFITLGSNN